MDRERGKENRTRVLQFRAGKIVTEASAEKRHRDTMGKV